jgi:hypothetical protein
MGLVCFALAIIEATSPDPMKPSRRIGLVVYALFGQYGLVGFLVVLGLFLVGVSVGRGSE